MKCLHCFFAGIVLIGAQGLQAQGIQTSGSCGGTSNRFAVNGPNLTKNYWKALQTPSYEPIKCNFPKTAMRHRAISAEVKTETAQRSILQRPALPKSYVTSDLRFRIHYTTTGEDAVDSTSTIVPGVPDYVYEAGTAAHRAYSLLVDTLGMKSHADDMGVDGPEYDFYLQNLGTFYSSTYPEFSGNSGPAYSVVENDFEEEFFSRGLLGLRVSIAHEYFHAVQLNYIFRSEDIFFFEMSSTWFEDFCYDEINDYYQLLPDWFENLSLPLNSPAGIHPFGSSLWLHYLTKRVKTSLVVRQLWEQVEIEHAIFAMKSVVEASPYNLPFGQSIKEFYDWHYFTGSRVDTVNYFDEGKEYPEIRFDHLIEVTKDTTIDGRLAPLAAHYFQFSRNAQDLNLFLQVDDPGRWQMTSITAVADSFSLLSAGGLSTLRVPAQGHADAVTVVVTHVGLPPSPTDSRQTDYRLLVSTITSVSDKSLNVPKTFVLRQNYPNPFNPTTLIRYEIPQPVQVTLAIYNLLGERVRTLVDAQEPTGMKQVTWDGRNERGRRVSSGVYVYRLEAGEFRMAKRLVLMK